jgi:hypothetical protein
MVNRFSLIRSRAELMAYSTLLAQQHEDEAQYESALGSGRLKSESRSYSTSAYSSSTARQQVDPMVTDTLVADVLDL